ncbi:hypothetical protein ATI61_11442 [Archangium gephyra]|uniref:Lipoprotein n=1 Tax=Archangium gephyra TaxID=48 RepID=A0AAC8Q5B1_9BACT|nr:hypothetical protein [Archangium gephyra]AKJ01256.1 Hypothetical protein AA314_02882 [Archangium gephyra]REG24434.1 hypothetical protein ATI61_11442 [Archangium gephyra]
MLRKIALLSTLLCACEPYTSPAPNIVSIEPEEVVSGETATISLKLDAPLPVKVDYGERTATVVTPILRIGGQAVPLTHVEQDGTLQATLPGSLSAGLQDVRLELGDGSGSISEQGLTVLPLPPAMEPWNADGGPMDPGEGRHLLVTAVRIDPIPDQISDVPFSITLRAEGPEAALFEGQVQLSTNKGHLRPNLSNAFSKGLRQEQVVLDKPGGNVVLTVRVGSTLVARSNPFKVSPK